MLTRSGGRLEVVAHRALSLAPFVWFKFLQFFGKGLPFHLKVAL